MKNTMKKILSLVLAAIMLVTTLPIAFAEGNTYKVGDIVQFGSYPQSKVTESEIISALNSKAPAWDKWTSYGYYSGSVREGTMKQGDWMRYTDLVYNNNKYRGVKFTQYRPHYTYYLSSSSHTYQDDNDYITDTVYWFKYEPINWRVLDPATGLVMCETIIDSQPYSNTIYYNSSVGKYFNDTSYTNYANDYETSSIRQWLNNDFYNTAFTYSEKKEIHTTTLNNDGYYTSVGATGYEALDSNSTNDKIFLLSYSEVINSKFGFDSSASANDPARVAQGSEYAKSQGLYVYKSSYITDSNNISCWFLRSPGGDTDASCGVDYYDSTYHHYFYVYDTYYGIRPALRVDLDAEIVNSEHNHSYSSVITEQPTHLEFGEMIHNCECGDSCTESIPKLTEHTYIPTVITPTCEDKGYTTYTCECGDNYVDNYIDATGHSHVSTVIPPTCTSQGYTAFICDCGDTYKEKYVDKLSHKDNNNDYKCDYNCGYDFGKTEPDEPEKELNFFQKIIQWFKDLFAKLFGWMK